MDINSRAFAAFLLCAVISVGFSGCKNNSENFNNTDNVSSTAASTVTTEASENKTTYIININTGKFHRPDCPSVKQMNENNRKKYVGDRDDLISNGYTPCKRCEP